MRNKSLHIVGILYSVILIISLLCMFGCSTTQTPVTTTGPAATISSTNTTVPSNMASTILATQPATMAATVSATSASVSKTLKIGLVSGLQYAGGVDQKRATELMIDLDNAQGGLLIGGEKYKIELISYDTNNTQSIAVAAINRLVFEDKVKLILSDGQYISAWLPITEANKVIVSSATLDYRTTMSPDFHYNFDSSFGNTQTNVSMGWFCKTFPDLAKNYVVAYPDSQTGHMISQYSLAAWGCYGITPIQLFYPSNATDLSSLGTKVMSLKPLAFSAEGGGDQLDGLVFKTVFNAGYRGQFFSISTQPFLTLTQVISPEALEGYICGAYPTEFDPALTQTAQDFKTAWIAKYGKWDGPQIGGVCLYVGLKTALIQANAVDDADKIAAVFGNGLKFEGPTGAGMMISRPDIGNNSTVDSVATNYMKKIVGGKPTLIATVDMNEALSLFRSAFPPAETSGK